MIKIIPTHEKPEKPEDREDLTTPQDPNNPKKKKRNEPCKLCSKKETGSCHLFNESGVEIVKIRTDGITKVYGY